MTQVLLVKDLFDRPSAVRKGDFVLKLSEGVEHAVATVQSYVVTPAIADALDEALGLVGSSLADGRSKASYVHGSFGSGKSHFMAMLSLLLRNDEHAWRTRAACAARTASLRGDRKAARAALSHDRQGQSRGGPVRNVRGLA